MILGFFAKLRKFNIHILLCVNKLMVEICGERVEKDRNYSGI